MGEGEYRYKQRRQQYIILYSLRGEFFTKVEYFFVLASFEKKELLVVVSQKSYWKGHISHSMDLYITEEEKKLVTMH